MAVSNKEVLGKEVIVQKAELENVLQFILLFILLLQITELKVHSELFPLFFSDKEICCRKEAVFS
jgi:hypothetical protein